MSWFNRRPKIKEPLKQTPHLSSPITDRKLEEAKDRGPKKKKATDKSKK
jgi:hypothetical protein